jgi:hypothetical protein
MRRGNSYPPNACLPDPVKATDKIKETPSTYVLLFLLCQTWRDKGHPQKSKATRASPWIRQLLLPLLARTDVLADSDRAPFPSAPTPKKHCCCPPIHHGFSCQAQRAAQCSLQKVNNRRKSNQSNHATCTKDVLKSSMELIFATKAMPGQLSSCRDELQICRQSAGLPQNLSTGRRGTRTTSQSLSSTQPGQ